MRDTIISIIVLILGIASFVVALYWRMGLPTELTNGQKTDLLLPFGLGVILTLSAVRNLSMGRSEKCQKK